MSSVNTESSRIFPCESIAAISILLRFVNILQADNSSAYQADDHTVSCTFQNQAAEIKWILRMCCVPNKCSHSTRFKCFAELFFCASSVEQGEQLRHPLLVIIGEWNDASWWKDLFCFSVVGEQCTAHAHVVYLQGCRCVCMVETCVPLCRSVASLSVQSKSTFSVFFAPQGELLNL